MIQRLFDLAAPIWRVMSVLGDLILLNVLLLATCVPVVTAGAGFTALYDTTRRMLDNSDDGVARTFWRSFRSNFAGASLIWAVMGPVLALLVGAWIFLIGPELLVLKFLFSFVYLLVFPFVWVMQARFVNTPMRTLRNAFQMAMGRLPFAFGAFAVHAVLLVVVVLTAQQLPQLLAPLILLGYPLAAYGSTPLLEHAIAPLLTASDD